MRSKSRLCVACKSFYFDGSTPWTMKCQRAAKGDFVPWAIHGGSTNTDEFRAILQTAEECKYYKKYKPLQFEDAPVEEPVVEEPVPVVEPVVEEPLPAVV